MSSAVAAAGYVEPGARRGRGPRRPAARSRSRSAAAHPPAGTPAAAAPGAARRPRATRRARASSVDGADRGVTPLELRAPAGPAARRARGESRACRRRARLELRAGERREETLRLAPQLGEVRFAARPPDAELVVDGESRGRADQMLQLLAVPHAIEIRREGFTRRARDGDAAAGLPADGERRAQEPRGAARGEDAARRPLARRATSCGSSRGCAFKMGASRREPGRRANEPLRDVELVRRFYVATREVSNAQFRRFEPGHSSGRVGAESLDVDDQPVVRVSWQQAAAYCNWLSEREGLPQAYAERDGRLRRRSRSAPAIACRPRPSGSGWPATPAGRRRSSTRGAPRCRCRPAPATTRTRGRAGSWRRCSTGYDDGFAATAPVQSFAPNALGFLHLGGNVGGVGPRPLRDHALGRGPARARPGGARRRASTM